MEPNLLRDFSYFRSLYPPLGAQILGSVIREVEKVSYPESFLFDEYPDAITLERMSGKILTEVQDELCATAQESQTSGNETSVGTESPSLALLIKALLFDEIMLLRQRRASIL